MKKIAETSPRNVSTKMPISPLIGLSTVSILSGILIPFIPIRREMILSLLFLCLVFVALVVQFFIAFSNKHRYIFHPMYFILIPFGIGYFLRSVNIIFFDFDTMSGFNSFSGPSYLWLALALALVSIAAMLIGYATPIGKMVAIKMPVFSSTMNSQRMWIVIIVYFIVGSFLYLAFIQSSGGIEFSLNDLTTKRRSDDLMGLRVGARFIFVGLYLLYIKYLIPQKGSRVYFVLLTLVIIGALLIPVTSNSRKDILAIFLVIAVLFHHFGKKISVAKLAIVGIILMYISLLVLSQRNAGDFDADRLTDVFSVEGFSKFFFEPGRHDYADITTIAHVVRYVEEGNDLFNGRMVTDFLGRFVPRKLWPEKPKNVGITIAALFYANPLRRYGPSYGVPPSIAADLYINFHLPGVLVGMFLFGIFIRLMYEYVNLYPLNQWVVLIYAVTLLFFFEQSKSDFASISSRYLQFVIPILAAAWFVSGRKTLDHRV